MTGSRNTNEQSPSSNCRIALTSCTSFDPFPSLMDNTSSGVNDRSISEDIPDHNENDGNCGATYPSVSGTELSVKSLFLSAGKPPTKPVSLADQYLDTMVMDEFWRAACLRKIRQTQRTVKASKVNATEPCRLVYNAHANGPKSLSQTRSKSQIKSKNPTSLDLKAKNNIKATSPRGSDSGFVSCSPTPNPPNYLRVRSTRKYPMQPPNPSSISLDIPASMVGRSCLSCRCTNTTCWRRTLGGIICNSCGLRSTAPGNLRSNGRYKKCGIICADKKCRYIPTRTEIGELKVKGIRGGRQCYVCHGEVIVCGEGVERHD